MGAPGDAHLLNRRLVGPRAQSLGIDFRLRGLWRGGNGLCFGTDSNTLSFSKSFVVIFRFSILHSGHRTVLIGSSGPRTCSPDPSHHLSFSCIRIHLNHIVPCLTRKYSKKIHPSVPTRVPLAIGLSFRDHRGVKQWKQLAGSCPLLRLLRQ